MITINYALLMLASVTHENSCMVTFLVYLTLTSMTQYSNVSIIFCEYYSIHAGMEKEILLSSFE